jgi:hypothetical protein
MEDKPLDEPFLSRWSRRKLAAKDEAPAAAEPTTDPSPAPAAAASAAGTPPREAVSAEAAPIYSPEYQQFFDPRVEEKLRRAALKKVFSEPQFNVMDGLDIYIDDYSKPDPIPDAMLRQLNQAKSLFLFEEEKQDADAGVPNTVASATAGAASPPTDAIAPPDPAAPGDAELDADLKQAVATEAPGAGSKND